MKGIEPSSLAWKAIALPLSYTRGFTSSRLPSLVRTPSTRRRRSRTQRSELAPRYEASGSIARHRRHSRLKAAPRGARGLVSRLSRVGLACLAACRSRSSVPNTAAHRPSGRRSGTSESRGERRVVRADARDGVPGSGECRIRTCEGKIHQIYSLTPLTARETPLWLGPVAVLAGQGSARMRRVCA